MYCIQPDAIEFIKGEMSVYACTYEELGIDVEAAIKRAEIPQYALELGTNPSGELITLPYLSDVSLFVYRRSIAKDVWGTDDPDEICKIIGGGSNSWDNFKDAAKTLKEHGYYIAPSFQDLAYSVDSNYLNNGDINPVWDQYMELSKYLYDNGYIMDHIKYYYKDFDKDTEFWTDYYYKDLGDKDSKVFGFITKSDLYYFTLDLENTVGDWAVCMAPYNIIHNSSNVFLVNKNSPNKDILGAFIEWLTLDISEKGYQYRAASGTIETSYSAYDEQKLSVISGTVLKTVDSSRDLFGGQNINPIIYEILKNPHCITYGIYNMQFLYWQDVIKSYLFEGKSKKLAIADYKNSILAAYPSEFELEADKVIEWKDKNFENAIRIILKKPKSDIYLSDVLKLTELNLSRKNIKSLEDIVYFKNLKRLYCEFNEVVDVSYLMELKYLEALYLGNNEIKDISSLGELKNLKVLSLIYNKISNITALKALTGLKMLELDFNEIEDISPLETLINLEELSISSNQIIDITVIGTLKNLKFLNLSNNNISDISCLGQLDNLGLLAVDSNKITDISVINNMKNLYSLYVRNNQIRDIGNLIGHTGLELLELSYNEIVDISSLSEFQNLESLYIAYNKITDLSPVGKMKNLKYLDVAGNDIKDKSPVEHVETVIWEYVSETEYNVE